MSAIFSKAGQKPAFPTRGPFEPGLENSSFAYPGISIRDYFAAHALVGILSGPASRENVPLKEWFDAPAIAFQLADAMIAARSEKDPRP